jgi:hypothetical protein
MIARHERLEAALDALQKAGFGPDDAWVGRAILTVYDAIRAFDEQRGTGEWPFPEPFVPLMDNAPAPAGVAAGADPPWLDEQLEIALNKKRGDGYWRWIAQRDRDDFRYVYCTVRAFEATQPLSEAEIGAAADNLRVAFSAKLVMIPRYTLYKLAESILIAAAKARSGG